VLEANSAQSVGQTRVEARTRRHEVEAIHRLVLRTACGIVAGCIGATSGNVRVRPARRAFAPLQRWFKCTVLGRARRAFLLER
jgi:hypothetical protein